MESWQGRVVLSAAHAKAADPVKEAENIAVRSMMSEIGDGYMQCHATHLTAGHCVSFAKDTKHMTKKYEGFARAAASHAFATYREARVCKYTIQAKSKMFVDHLKAKISNSCVNIAALFETLDQCKYRMDQPEAYMKEVTLRTLDRIAN